MNQTIFHSHVCLPECRWSRTLLAAEARVVGAGRGGSQLEIGGDRCRQILEAVHGEVDPSVPQGGFQLRGEHSLPADFRERSAGTVPCGADDLEAGFDAVPGRLPEQRADALSLGEGEPAAAGANGEGMARGHE